MELDEGTRNRILIIVVAMIALCVGLIIALAINWPTITWTQRIVVIISAVAAIGIGFTLFCSPKVIGEKKEEET